MPPDRRTNSTNVSRRRVGRRCGTALSDVMARFVGAGLALDHELVAVARSTFPQQPEDHMPEHRAPIRSTSGLPETSPLPRRSAAGRYGHHGPTVNTKHARSGIDAVHTAKRASEGWGCWRSPTLRVSRSEASGSLRIRSHGRLRFGAASRLRGASSRDRHRQSSRQWVGRRTSTAGQGGAGVGARAVGGGSRASGGYPPATSARSAAGGFAGAARPARRLAAPCISPNVLPSSRLSHPHLHRQEQPSGSSCPGARPRTQRRPPPAQRSPAAGPRPPLVLAGGRRGEDALGAGNFYMLQT